MNAYFIKFLSNRKNSGTEDERSLKYKKNASVLIVSQVFSLLASMLLVPVALKCLGIDEYGVWITLTTIIGWFSFFDIGLGNGLRNKYAEAKALNKKDEINYYVSTTFFSLVIISFLIFLVYLVANAFVSWSAILAAPESMEHDLKIVTAFVVITFCLKFVFNIIPVLLTSDQDPAIPALLNLISNLLSLLCIYILSKSNFNSFLSFGICLSLTQLFPYIVAFLFFFKTRYSGIMPKISNFKRTHVNAVLALGFRYFLIQLTGLVLYQTTNFIIAHVCSLKDVTEFNVSYKYITVLYIAFTTILNPFWSTNMW